MRPKPLAWIRVGDCINCISHAGGTAGYPQKKGTTFARMVLFRRYGKQPYEICARHTCDNRLCINPDHIIPGTRGENASDRIARGRLFFGETNPAAKLTENDVREIRRLKGIESQRSLGRRFGVWHTTIGVIHRGKWWKNVT